MNTKTIVYFKHGIGNLIMFTPAIQAIASMDESKQVDICLDSEWNDYRRPAFDDFFSKWSLIQNIVNYPKDDFTKEYKTWFYTGHSEHSKALDIFKERNRLQMIDPDWSSGIHEIFYYMNMISKYGYHGSLPDQYIPITDKINIDKNGKYLIGICNGTYAGNMKTVKQWFYFNELVKLLKYYYNCQVVKLGYRDELMEVNTDFDFVNKLSLTETAYVIKQLDLFITNDTALMHVGDALQTNMIVLWGGSMCSKNGALSKNAYNLKLNLPCQPCQRTGMFYNCNDPICLNNLTVGDVMVIVKDKLKNDRSIF